MDLGEQLAQVAAYNTDEIYWHLKNNAAHFGNQGVLLLCDQLLQRRQPIKHVGRHFEELLRQLSTRKLRYLETHDYAFSKATVHVAFKELTKRGQSTSQWYWHDGKTQQGPLNRMQVEARIDRGAAQPEHSFWKEGWSEWKRLADLQFLTGKLYYQQDFPESQADRNAPPPPPPPPPGASTSGAGRQHAQSNPTDPYWNTPVRGSNDGLVTASAVLTFISAPMWLIVAICTPFSSWGEAVGIFLPVAFSIYMAAACIPYGIGLLNRRYWAWWASLVSSALGAGWMLMKVAVYHDGGAWLFVLLIEAVLVTFLAVTKNDFN